MVEAAAGDGERREDDDEALIVVMRASGAGGGSGDGGLPWAWNCDVGDTLVLDPPFGCGTGDRGGARGPDLEPLGLCIAERMMGQWAGGLRAPCGVVGLRLVCSETGQPLINGGFEKPFDRVAAPQGGCQLNRNRGGVLNRSIDPHRCGGRIRCFFSEGFLEKKARSSQRGSSTRPGRHGIAYRWDSWRWIVAVLSSADFAGVDADD